VTTTTRSGFIVLLGLVAAAASGRPVFAQPDVEDVSVRPIECWWRTAASAVRVGQLFDVVLTCATLDTASTTVVPDRSRLDPSVLQLSPFEVVSGAEADDLQTTARRFFQYQYTLRYIGEDFGRDVPLPPLTLNYRVQSRVDADDAAIESRDREYILPSQLVRILSLVPASAGDIRDRAPDTFLGIQDRRFNARLLQIGGWTAFGLAIAVLVRATARTVGQRRRRDRPAIRPLPAARVLARADTVLADVSRSRRDGGWSPDLVTRALAALRLVAAYDTSGRIAETRVGRGHRPAEGQLLVGTPLVPGRTTVVSGSATAAAIERERQQSSGVNGSRQGRLADLQAALSALESAAYGRRPVQDGDLDEALESGRRAAASARRAHGWAATQLAALRRILSKLPGPWAR